MKQQALRVIMLFSISTLAVSCASPPKFQSVEREYKAKEFPLPALGWSGLYIYAEGNGRWNPWLGLRQERSKIYVDGRYAGDITGKAFLWRQVTPGSHHIEIEPSRTGENFIFVSGVNHFIRVRTQTTNSVSEIITTWRISEERAETAITAILTSRLAQDGDGLRSDLKFVKGITKAGAGSYPVAAY